MMRAKVCGGGRAESGRYMPWGTCLYRLCRLQMGMNSYGHSSLFFLGVKVLLLIALVHLLRDFGA